ncbi:hypothetical protein [Curtobacterium sp. MCBD17_023]|uniref:hypothetical protein n=1 Tax=Curtobacterium sp. MCBD17_023 TaxID=2175657 RepID=UPI000D86E702|nr:hypothetical protein [Curtobacterium sp. MCBD17_023]PYY48066.1 hypothetical protein DEI84_10275 [Curtobacterium sp. MCBD17_023]
MYRLGWQVFRTQFRQDVSVDRLRRALVVGGVVAVGIGVLLAVTDAGTGWMDVGPGLSPLVVVLGALAAGLITVSCFPVRRRDEPPATINGYQVRPDTMRIARHSVQRYLGRRMPDIEADDRAAVLNDTALVRRTLVVDVMRAAPGLLGFALIGVVALLLGGRHGLGFLAVFGYLGLVPDRILRLGRAERAHRAAAALPPTGPGSTTPTGRNRFPSGSKVGLPDV